MELLTEGTLQSSKLDPYEKASHWLQMVQRQQVIVFKSDLLNNKSAQSQKMTSHYSDVVMGTIASQIASLTIVYSIIYSDADQRKNQSSASLALVRGIHRGPVNSPHKWPVTRKMFPFDDVIMTYYKHVTTCWTYHFQTTKVITLRWPIPCWMNNTIQFIENRHMTVCYPIAKFVLRYRISHTKLQSSKRKVPMLTVVPINGAGRSFARIGTFP